MYAPLHFRDTGICVFRGTTSLFLRDTVPKLTYPHRFPRAILTGLLECATVFLSLIRTVIASHPTEDPVDQNFDIVAKYPDLGDPEFLETFDFSTVRTRMDRSVPFSEFDVAAALAYTNGNLTTASRLLGRSRRSVEGFVTRNTALLEFLEDIVAAKLDMIEEQNFDLGMQGDPGTMRFVLQTLGKQRGYSTRAEVTGKGGGAVNVVIEGNDSGL